MNYLIREMMAGEYKLLDDFLYEAIFIPEGEQLPPKSIIELPELQVYVAGFGQEESDFCLVAEVEQKVEEEAEPKEEQKTGQNTEKKIVGAVWARIMNDYGHIEAAVPSLAVSLYKEYRNLGIGTALLQQMLCLLRQNGYKKVSLAVQKANYAVKMYKKLGFEIVAENAEEYIMACYLKKTVGNNRSSLGDKIADENKKQIKDN